MNNVEAKTLTLKSSEDVVRMRQAVREYAIELGFGLVDQTKLVTAASELARNAIIYGGGGEVKVETLTEGERRGIGLTFSDHGPGTVGVQARIMPSSQA